MIAFVLRLESYQIKRSIILNCLGLDRKRFARWQRLGDAPSVAFTPPPRDGALTQDEKRLIIKFYVEHRKDGYRRCTYMMQDKKIIGISASTVYTVLDEAQVLRPPRPEARLKGFHQPTRPHEHWHIDFTSFNIGLKAWHLVSIIDGYTRAILAWGLFENASQKESQLILQQCVEKYKPEGVELALIADNGGHFRGENFTALLKQHGIVPRWTRPYHPQSNGKLERWHKSLKHEAIHPGCPQSVEELREIIAAYVKRYNYERLHSANAYIAPMDIIENKKDVILQARKTYLEEQRLARRRRQPITGGRGVQGDAQSPAGVRGSAPPLSQLADSSAAQSPQEVANF